MKKIETISEIESAMNALQTLDSKVKARGAKLSQEIASLREKMNADLQNDINEHHRLQAEIENWAWSNKTNPEFFPAGKRSILLNAGTIGFRLGALSVSLKKGMSTEKVIEIAKGMKLGEIIRTSEDLNKDAVKELVEEEKLDETMLKQLGIVINQSETFNIKLNDQ